MPNKFKPRTDPDRPTIYQIRIKGHLGREWADLFDGIAITLLAAALSTIFGQMAPFSPVFILLNVPIGVQEMVLAVWLIVRGFSSSASAFERAEPATKDVLRTA